LTGGSIVFFLATKCYIVDITSEENRTTRMAVTDAFFGVGYLIGLPIGTYIKKEFGYVPLFSITLGLVICAMIYAAVFLKDSYQLISVEQKKVFDAEREENQLKCDRGKGIQFVNKLYLIRVRCFQKHFQNDHQQFSNSLQKTPK
jgi:fucose permease